MGGHQDGHLVSKKIFFEEWHIDTLIWVEANAFRCATAHILIRLDMPRSAPTPCRYPGCSAVLAVPGFCAPHQTAVHREYGRARRSFDSEVGFYQSSNWRQLRASFLRLHPLCRVCAERGTEVAARVVDHVVPLKAGGGRFDTNNLQPLCIPCHNRKTAIETARCRSAGNR